MIVNLIGLLMEPNAVMQLRMLLVFHVLRLKAAMAGIVLAVDVH